MILRGKLGKHAKEKRGRNSGPSVSLACEANRFWGEDAFAGDGLKKRGVTPAPPASKTGNAQSAPFK